MTKKYYTIDTETKGLDATKYIIGDLYDGKKHYTHTKKEELWKEIIKKKKKDRTIQIYAHNHAYDYYAYGELTNPKVKFFSERPFIASYNEEGKEKIKFLCTTGLYPRLTLKEIGEMIETEKIETPEELKKGEEIPIQKIIPYLHRDTEIVHQAVHYIQNQLEKDKIQIRRLYTIYQIAIEYMLKEFKKHNIKNFFYNKKLNQVIYTKHKKLIHEALRGGRVEAFKTGKHENTTYIDRNSQYPQSCMDIKFPNIKTETKINNPLASTTKKELLEKIGISRALLYNKTNEIGLIPIRFPNYSYYPKKETYMIGTYTHKELKTAEEEGYKIIAIEWSITWEEQENIYKKIIPKLYEKRKEGKFQKWFYKAIMVGHLGKLAQHRNNQELLIDSVEEYKKYTTLGYEAIKGMGLNYLYKKTEVKQEYKPYYCPIIPTLVNAEARIAMYKEMKKIGIKDLIYTDTDSIIYTGEHKKKFDIGNNIGQFKIEHENKEALIWGRKTYRIGTEIRAGGIAKIGIKPEEFEKGYVTNIEIKGIKSTEKIEETGSPKTTTIDLKKLQETFTENQEELEKQKIFMDYTIPNIDYFLPYIEKEY